MLCNMQHFPEERSNNVMLSVIVESDLHESSRENKVLMSH